MDATTLTKKTLTRSNKYKKENNSTTIQNIHELIDNMDTTKKTSSVNMNRKKHPQQHFFIKQQLIFHCPYCKEIITFDKSQPINSKIPCPYCGYHYLKAYTNKNDKTINKSPTTHPQKQSSTKQKKHRLNPKKPQKHRFKAKKPLITIKIPRFKPKTKKTTTKKPKKQKPSIKEESFFKPKPKTVKKPKPPTKSTSFLKKIPKIKFKKPTKPQKKKKTIKKEPFFQPTPTTKQHKKVTSQKKTSFFNNIPKIKIKKPTKKPFLTIKKPRFKPHLPKPNLKQLQTQTKTFIKNNPIELILLLIGLLFLIQPTLENLKISLTLLIIGAILLLPTEKNTTKHDIPKSTQTKTDQLKSFFNRFSNQEKISITLISWVLFLFIITTAQQLEIYFILIFIGILLTKELTTDYLSNKTQKRINLYIFLFLIIYIYLITQKIMETLITIP